MAHRKNGFQLAINEKTRQLRNIQRETEALEREKEAHHRAADEAKGRLELRARLYVEPAKDHPGLGSGSEE